MFSNLDGKNSPEAGVDAFVQEVDMLQVALSKHELQSQWSHVQDTQYTQDIEQKGNFVY